MSELADFDTDKLARHIYIMRKAGHTFSDIQQRMLDSEVPAPSLETMMRLCRDYQVKMAQHFQLDDRRTLLHLELERLDDLQASLWERAIAGDLATVDRVLKVMGHRAKITGMDQLATVDKDTAQTVLIVGGNQAAFLEALENGRRRVTGDDQDDEEDEEAQ